jgi:uncharacterized FlaG/YvyC family protein
MSVQNISLMTGSFNLPSGSVADKPVLPQPKVIETNTTVAASADPLQKAVDEANQLFSHVRPDIKFVIDEASKEVVMMLVEPETGDVVNRYPTEHALAISHEIAKAQAKVAERHEVFRNIDNGLLGLFVEQKI